MRTSTVRIARFKAILHTMLVLCCPTPPFPKNVTDGLLPAHIPQHQPLQGMAQGIELARQNKSGEPVRVIVTDASTWYFFGLQAVKKGSAADPQAGGAGVSAGSAAVQGATGAGGLEFSFRKSEETSEETFRLFDCATVNANVLGRNEPSSVYPASALRAVEASLAQGTGPACFRERTLFAAMKPTAYCALPRLHVRHWGLLCV